MREKRSWPGHPGASVNIEVWNKCIADFCKSCNFRSLITKPMCFKNSENPSCIDLVLTNSTYSVQSRSVIETSFS